jgi:hypothetical protein
MPTIAEEFETFWNRYPRKVKRLDAMKAYQKARIVATPEQILAGVLTLLQNLPEAACFVPHASSWLNAERWTDSYEVTTPSLFAADADWFMECRVIHNGECGGDRMAHHIRKQLDTGKAQGQAS